MTATTNRHQARSVSTRETLKRIALELFAERGFDDVKIAEIAGAGGVSERTFYGHFPTKEAVLFQDYQRRLDWLSAALDMRPSHEPVLESVRVAVRSFPDDFEIVHQAALLRSSLIDGERAAEQMRVVQASFAAVLLEFVQKRLVGQPSLVALVGANVLAAALVSAVDAWGQGGCEGNIDVMVDEALDLVRTGLQPLQS